MGSLTSGAVIALFITACLCIGLVDADDRQCFERWKVANADCAARKLYQCHDCDAPFGDHGCNVCIEGFERIMAAPNYYTCLWCGPGCTRCWDLTPPGSYLWSRKCLCCGPGYELEHDKCVK